MSNKSEILTVVWLRNDLRLEDNAALAHAASNGAVLPVFVWDPDAAGPWSPGSASRVWLHHALEDFSRALAKLGAPLAIVAGDTAEKLLEVAAACGADAIVWNRDYDPTSVALGQRVKASAGEAGIAVKSFAGAVINEPQAIRNRQGLPFKVFTAYWKHCAALADESALNPANAPAKLKPGKTRIASQQVSDLQLLPEIRWDVPMLEGWQPTIDGAAAALQSFVEAPVHAYIEGRDQPGRNGVSRLAPYLRFGQLTPKLIMRAVNASTSDGTDAYVRQLYWRDFARHLLFHFPQMPDEALNPAFSAFPWATAEVADDPMFKAWTLGQTGYPLIDAGMRELWQTGYMHNRVRMNVASFLVKHLLIDWRAGERWFWDTLIDADLPNNSMGWQWAAGCGVDAAPYFRIFNPMVQGERFDADGSYVRRWVPELARLPNRWIHKPFQAPALELQAAGVRLGETYPHPVVDHAEARADALAALASIKKTS